MKIEEKLLEIQTRLKAAKSRYNKFGDYNYRSCEDILEGVKPLLKELKCILLLSDEMKTVGDRVYVMACAKLVDCEEETEVSVYAWAREEESRPKMAEPQCTGSASSYARKYALNGLFCLDDTKDADTMDNSKTKPIDKIDGMKVKALQLLCQRIGVNEADLCVLYKVKSLDQMTEKMFANINQHESDIQKKLGGKNE